MARSAVPAARSCTGRPSSSRGTSTASRATRERRRVQRCSELPEGLVALGDLPEEEVGVRPDTRRRVRTQVVKAVGEVLDDFCEGVLGGLALLDRQPPPRRIDAEEGVRDVLALHERMLAVPSRTSRSVAGPGFTGATAESRSRYFAFGFGTRSGNVVGFPPIARPRLRRGACREPVQLRDVRAVEVAVSVSTGPR